jgi:DNA modification methylase
MIPYLSDPDVTLYQGDALDVLRTLPVGAADACVTSPPYLDSRPEYPAAELLPIFREVLRRGIGIDLSADYLDMAARRLQQQSLFAMEVEA